MARRGPNTPRGKAASSRNAVKHGLRSDAPVIPELESFEDWERHRAGIVASFQPEGGFETFLAERIASLSWRLNRVPRYETEMTVHEIDRIGDDLGFQADYGETLGIPREKTVTMDKVDEMLSRRLLPSKDPMERIMRGACPERSGAQAADAEGKATSTASSSRPYASSKPPRACPEDGAANEGPAAKATAHLRWPALM